MIDLKKIIIAKKIKKFIFKKPIIVLYHYNNMNSLDWISLKKDLCTTQIKILKIKNKFSSNKNLESTFSLKQNRHRSLFDSVGISLKGKKDNNKIFNNSFIHASTDNNKKFKLDKIHNLNLLFQGPTLIATCESFDCLQKLNTCLKKYKKFVLIGGEIKNQEITHLDFNFLIQLNSSVYTDFLKSVKIFLYKMLVFQKGYNFSYLKTSSYKLIFILHFLLSISSKSEKKNVI